MKPPIKYELGLIGLGVMGRNFLLNLADHDHTVAGYDRDPAQVSALVKEAGNRKVAGVSDLAQFVGLLREPRAIMLLVPAGPPVDSVITELLPHLEMGDLVIDAGNSYFRDTDARAGRLAARGIDFLGVGISGGEEGARRGPSIMPGGPRDAYSRVQSLLESGAAQINGEPCVAYLGPGSAGHFVKMVHNGIEYAVMQLIAETYDVMKRGLGLSDDELHEFYAGWNRGESEGYLLEITAKIFSKVDGKTGRRLIDEVKGVAQQLGTGRWTSQTALHLGTPSPTIDIAVAMRSLSELGDERKVASKLLLRPVPPFPGDSDKFLQQLSRALSAATQIAYAQGFAVLRSGSDEQGYNLDLATIARIWRGGCIIRTALLEHMREAFQAQPALRNLLADPGLAKRMMAHQEDLRIAVIKATQLGLPVPGLMSALSYLDAYRSEWVPANLIQAQRDYFGAHTYERTDLAGTFHTAWAAAETS